MSQSDIKNFFDNIAPDWDGMERRTDEEILSLLRRVGIKRGDRVLDLGCGTGRITSLLNSLSENKVLGMDVSPKMIEIAREKYKDSDCAEFICGDFLDFDFAEKFDVVVIYNAYPHFMLPEILAKKLSETVLTDGRFTVVHSLGRNRLTAVHSACDDKITRILKSPDEESKAFAPYFDICLAEEGENYYLIVGTKR